MTIPSSITVDIYLTVNWFVSFCAKKIDAVIDTQALDSPTWEPNDDDAASIGHCATDGLTHRVINTPGSVYRHSTTLAQVRCNTHSRF